MQEAAVLAVLLGAAHKTLHSSKEPASGTVLILPWAGESTYSVSHCTVSGTAREFVDCSRQLSVGYFTLTLRLDLSFLG